MITHVFKIIWNSKKNNALIITEIFISFIVLFVVSAIGLHNYRLYNQPLGFSSENVWHIKTITNNVPYEQLYEGQDRVLKRLQALPQIKSVSFPNNGVPYQPALTSNQHTASFNGQAIKVRVWEVDEAFFDVMGLILKDGKWLNNGNVGLRVTPIVVNDKLISSLFKNDIYLGQVLDIGNEKFQVVGRIEDYRQAENIDVEPAFFRINNTKKNLNQNGNSLNVLIKLNSATDLGFEEKLLDEVTVALGDLQPIVSIASLENQRESYLESDFKIGLIMLSVCCFLIGNVIVGLFGVFWQNVSRRYYEIGVRRAVGATEMLIYRQMVVEVIVLATLSILPACMLAVQFLFFNPFGFNSEVYIIAILLASLVIYSLVTLCSLYPSWRAAKIHPAVALRSE